MSAARNPVRVKDEPGLTATAVPELIAGLRAAAGPPEILAAACRRLAELTGALQVLALAEQGRAGLECLAASTAAPNKSQPELDPALQHQVRAAIESGQPEVLACVGGEPVLPATCSGLLAVPVKTAQTAAALLLYCGKTPPAECESAAVAVAALAALVLSERELSAAHQSQAHDLAGLLGISSELGSIGELDRFLQKFVVRAAQFLGFARAFVAPLEGDVCRIRWVAEEGEAKPMVEDLRAPLAKRVLASAQPFHTEDISQAPGVDRELAERYHVTQYLAVPLVGSGGRPLGLFGVLDRLDGKPVSAEDVQRGQALAAQAGLVLEATQNLHLAEQHRRRAESLVSLALDLNPADGLAEFVRSFTPRAAAMLEASAAVLALHQGNALEIVSYHQPGATHDAALLRRLGVALAHLLKQEGEPVVTGPAPLLLGEGLAAALGWRELALARLKGGEGEPIGLLCLADPRSGLPPAAYSLLQALAGHGSVALENSRLFSRVAQANRQWMEIFDAMTDYIVVHDDSHRILRVNRALSEYIGVRPAQLIGMAMPALSVLAGESAAECPFCRGGGHEHDEYVHPVLERTYLVSTSHTQGAVSEGQQTIHVIRDITDRREAERRYRELFDNIQEGLFFSTPEGRFIEVNDALVRMLGYGSREELLQVDIPTQVYPAPEQRLAFQQALEQEGTLRNLQETLRRKDGSLVYTLGNTVAVRDSAGRVLQYRGLILDITELKTFQAQLQHERDLNSKILNNTQSLILVADTEGFITFANRRCIEAGGFAPEDVLGRRLEDFVPAEQRSALTRAFSATLYGRQVDNLELPILDARGQQGRFSVNLSPMRDEGGQVTSIVCVMTDITDAAMLQAKLMHTEKMAAVGQLVSGVAHEVNNPLTAILGFADLLLEHPGIPEPARKNLQLILHEAQRTKTIVQNLLSFARQVPPHREAVDLNDVVHRTLQLRQYDFASHGVEILERLAPGLPPVIGDSHQLQQVFLNIINNAYDAVREAGGRGRIEIETALRGRQAEILFRDNGPGIAHPDRIFDPFFTTKEVGKGTGLGLSICYGIVREHGGEITCHNHSAARGATFCVRLPLAEAAHRGVPDAQAAAVEVRA